MPAATGRDRAGQRGPVLTDRRLAGRPVSTGDPGPRTWPAGRARLGARGHPVARQPRHFDVWLTHASRREQIRIRLTAASGTPADRARLMADTLTRTQPGNGQSPVASHSSPPIANAPTGNPSRALPPAHGPTPAASGLPTTQPRLTTTARQDPPFCAAGGVLSGLRSRRTEHVDRCGSRQAADCGWADAGGPGSCYGWFSLGW
jgi:hypothetical protein